MKWILCLAVVACGCAGCQSPAPPYNPFASTTTVPPPGTAVPPPYYGAPPLTAPPQTMPVTPTAPPPTAAPIPRPAGLNNFSPAPAGSGGYSSTFQPNVSQPQTQPAAATLIPGAAPASGFGAPPLTPVSGRGAPSYGPPGGNAYPPQANRVPQFPTPGYSTPTLAPANPQLAQGTPTLAPPIPAAAGAVPWNSTAANVAQSTNAATGSGVVPAAMWQPADPARAARSSNSPSSSAGSNTNTASSNPAFSNSGSAIRIVDPARSNASGPGGNGSSIGDAISTAGSPTQGSSGTSSAQGIGELPPARITDISPTASSAALTPISPRNVALQPIPRGAQ
jgi:hypothetical protein